MTLYWKPPDSSRVDFTDASGENVIFLTTGGTSYICSESGGEGSCFASPTGGAPLPFLSFLSDPEQFSNDIEGTFGGLDVDTSDRTIAGEDGHCFSASGSVEGEEGSVEYCFNDDGVLLLLSGGGGGTTFRMEATAVEGTVTDADVALPYDVIDLGQ